SALGIIIRSIDTNTGKLDKKLDQVIGRLDTLSKRQFELETSVRSLQASQDVLAAGVSQSVRPAPQNSIDDGDLDSVPSEFRISIEELCDIYKCTNRAGNMASHLVKRLFPELFGPAQLRFQYNWYGNGETQEGTIGFNSQDRRRDLRVSLLSGSAFRRFLEGEGGAQD
ncbi:hypothetical protein FSP39_016541, partial [Pinctada imbricata]